LFDPASSEIRTLCAPPPEPFIAEHVRRGRYPPRGWALDCGHTRAPSRHCP
jgi:hypothetical protein